MLGVHEGRYDRDSGLLGVPDAHSLARGAYLMDARVAPGVLLPGAPHSNAGGAFLPFPPGPGRGVPADPLPPLPVVRLRGLPFQCSEEDVLEFFAGLEVLDVVLPRREGRATGDAWVLLASPPQCALALQVCVCSPTALRCHPAGCAAWPSLAVRSCALSLSLGSCCTLMRIGPVSGSCFCSGTG